MITRASPYVFGMLSATLYHLNKSKDYLHEASVLLEWSAFLAINLIALLGPNLPAWVAYS
jgi:hypothetical protein